MRLSLTILAIILFGSLKGQSILLEVHPRVFNYKYNTAWAHHAALLFNLNKRWTMGPSLFLENDVTRTPYMFIYLPGHSTDPIHTTYRVRNGKVLYYTEKFNRGLGGQLVDGYTVEDEYAQAASLGLLVGFSFIKTKRWDAYVRVIPYIVRYRLQFDFLGLPSSPVRMNLEDEYTIIDFSSKRVNYTYDADFRYSAGVLYRVLPKLYLGVDAHYVDIQADIPNISFSLMYSFNNKN